MRTAPKAEQSSRVTDRRPEHTNIHADNGQEDDECDEAAHIKTASGDCL